MDISKIKKRISALLAKAHSTDSPEEKDAFLKKAAELLNEHQIEAFELHEEDPIGVTYGIKGQPGPPSYKSKVQVALAYLYGCHTVRMFNPDGKTWTVHIVGAESARITTELMTPFVWAQVTAAGRELHKAGSAGSPAIGTRDVAKSLVVRVWEIINSRKPPQPGTTAASMAIVVAHALDLFEKEHYPKTWQAKTRPIETKLAANELAKGISIEEQIDGPAEVLALR